MAIVGDLVGPLDIGPVAHGGHFVAHLAGRVVFVRHALPGERVMARVTQVNAKIMRADAEKILLAAPQRVVPACPVARPGGCGGCDFQHIDVRYQRELKAQVLADQLRRLAGIAWDGTVEAPSADDDGLGWRTRMRYLVRGGLGMRAHRSHRFVPLPPSGCLIAAPALRHPSLDAGRIVPARERATRRTSAVQELIVGVGPDGASLGSSGQVRVSVAGRTYRLTGESFWQIHPSAADTLAEAVIEGLKPRAGESALDLYCGAGLFAGVLADLGIDVTGIDQNADATALAAANVPEAVFHTGAVEHLVTSAPSTDLVVLDPSRSGAGWAVMGEVLRHEPRAVAYVACDPASLARDLAELPESYSVSSIRAFDLFPMTQHFETVAILEKTTPLG